jgi:TPP-dependent pyruvate/acetoin dehydrogenase alpha subunit
MELLAVYGAAETAIARARAGEGPTLIEARAYRYMPNTSNDDDTRYRSREEVAEWRQRDPIPRLRGHLLDSGALTDKTAATLEAKIGGQVAEAAEWAEGQPDAQPEDVLLHTWADGPVAALDWMRPSAEGALQRQE